MSDNDSNMKSFTKSKFVISGFPMKPDELTKFLGIEPTRIREKGELVEKYNLEIKENSWSIDSGLDKETDVQTQIEFLLDKLRPYKNKLIIICNEYPPSFVSTVRIYGGDRPALDLSREIIKELSEYNAEFGIDIYVFDQQ